MSIKKYPYRTENSHISEISNKKLYFLSSKMTEGNDILLRHITIIENTIYKLILNISFSSPLHVYPYKQTRFSVFSLEQFRLLRESENEFQAKETRVVQNHS